MFIDQVKIFLKAGRGGDGCLSFRREKYVPFGGPDGGPGGSGGSIYFRATRKLTTLNHFFLKKHFAAQDGKAGGSKNKAGACGEDLYIDVPCGTIIKDETGQIVADLWEEGEVFLAAKGGSGGRGNKSFASSTNQAPRIRELGEPGEEKVYTLELHLLADVGLVGKPNAGKSTFLSIVSRAQPKIADYPFTTLSPVLGSINLGVEGSFLIADIPGLIEGAHEGKGLGIQFLRHISRVRLLLFLIDISDLEPWMTFEILKNELESYSPSLLEKEMVVAFSKADLLENDEELLNELKREFLERYPQLENDLFVISSIEKVNLDKLLYHLNQKLQKIPRDYSLLKKEFQKEKEQLDFAVYTLNEEDEFEIEIQNGLFIVKGEEVERIANMTDFENEESLHRFWNYLDKKGINQKLKDKGIKEGDTVVVGQREFVWVD